MLRELIILATTILPSIGIVTLFVMSDEFREPNKEIIKVFIYGIIITFFAFIFNTYLHEIYLSRSIDKKLIESFLTAAPVEEGLKFLVLFFLVYRMKDFNEPLDGIVYGICVSLGFATLENIFYVYFKEFNYDQIYVSLSRSISAIPAHGVFGVFMGYFFMKFAFLNKNKKGNLFLCFFVPFLLHGTYNFLITEFLIIALLFILIAWIIALMLFKKLKVKQKSKTKEFEPKI